MPSIQRVGSDGTVEALVTSAGGEPLVGPNDLAFGPDGRLYFTDPGIFDPEHPDPGRICVVDPAGRPPSCEEVGPCFPNGIVAEPDGSVVWDESFTRRVGAGAPTDRSSCSPPCRGPDPRRDEVAADGNRTSPA